MLNDRRVLQIQGYRLTHIRLQFVKRIRFGETTRQIRHLCTVPATFLSDYHVIQAHDTKLSLLRNAAIIPHLSA